MLVKQGENGVFAFGECSHASFWSDGGEFYLMCANKGHTGQPCVCLEPEQARAFLTQALAMLPPAPQGAPFDETVTPSERSNLADALRGLGRSLRQTAAILLEDPELRELVSGAAAAEPERERDEEVKTWTGPFPELLPDPPATTRVRHRKANAE